jgi:beta-glucosidase
MFKFPGNFLWGAATSAYQVEGGNTRADWWQWEKETGKEPSGDACRHYELYEQDFDLAKGLHHNAHRLSLEWSRIEPEEGKFSEEALEHYLNVVLALKARGIEPLVTLHHFTNPAWLAQKGGWENPGTVKLFLKYTDFVLEKLASQTRYWITINEPTVYVYESYIMGLWPPQAKSLWRARTVENHLAAAHIKAYRLIHETYRREKMQPPLVSIAQHMQDFVPCVPDFRNKLAAFLRHRLFNLGLIDKFRRHKALDFIGVNYYSRQRVEVQKWGVRNLFMDICVKEEHRVPETNSSGWEVYPEGLCRVLLRLKGYHLPIVITENGICTPDDALRWRYIEAHLRSVHRAIREGAPVTGYLYWSLMDNFEWHDGFGPRFGLIGIDYPTQQRTVRESAVQFGKVCETGVLDENP